MLRRTLLAVLWFFPIAWGWNLVAAWAGLPSVAGLAIGVVAAAFMLTAPGRVIPVLALRSPAQPVGDVGAIQRIVADGA